MSKILILGGSGLISTPMTQGLIDRGDEVWLFRRGTDDVFSDVPTIHGNRDNLADKQAAAAKGPFDCVIDMIGFTKQHALDDIAAFSGKTKQLIFCSTFNVFSQPVPGLPISNDGPRHPRTSFEYALDKADMERTFEAAAQEGAFALTIIRCSATYQESGLPLPIIGGHGNDAAIPTLTRILQGKPIVVPGDGTSTWSATFRDDTASAFVGAAGNEKAYNKAYTLMSETSLTWEEYYRIAARAWDAPEPTFVHVSSDLVSACLPQKTFWLKEAFHYHCYFDITPAKQDLGYRCKTSWYEGSLMQKAWHERQGDIHLQDDPEYEFFVSNYARLERELIDSCRGLSS
ncbi:NAD-dependent epimerase/dehydratase family protein [Eubacteriales bacterium OttesenSCG-928-N13]|nr:NAD-dependent epimerase/dehydratase family protein [Eubacteriales bacterium OttesenSCG-928-N13]